MGFFGGLLLGFFVGAPVGFFLACLARSLASQDLEGGEVDTDVAAGMGLIVILALIVLALWFFSGWELPL